MNQKFVDMKYMAQNMGLKLNVTNFLYMGGFILVNLESVEKKDLLQNLGPKLNLTNSTINRRVIFLCAMNLVIILLFLLF